VNEDQDPTKPRRFWLKLVVGLAITGSLFLFLARFIDPEQLGAMFASTRLDLCLAGFGLWLVLYLARTWRMVLLAPRTPPLTMLCIASVHNFLLRLLPMRTGDLSWAFLVKRAGAAGLGESLLNLLLLRILDVTAVVIFFAAALGLDQGGVYQGDHRAGLVWACVAGGGMLMFILLMGPMLRFGLGIFRWMCGLVGILENQKIQSLLGKISGAVESFSEARPRVLLMSGVSSVVVWMLTYGVFFTVMRALGMEVSVAQVVLGATAGVVTGFLPGGIGSFGTLEAGWTLGFVLVGLGKSEAAASGIGVSLITLVYAAIMAAVTWPVLNRLGRGD